MVRSSTTELSRQQVARDLEGAVRDETFWRRHPALWRFWRRKLGVVGIIIVLAIALVAFLAPILPLRDPTSQALTARFAGIGERGYWLGSDAFGRDLLSRLIWGGRISLVAGTIASMSALAIGVPIGMVAGYRGGIFDTVVMRIVDMLLAFPYILLAIVIVATLGPGLRNALIAVAVTSVPFYVRIIRGIVLTVKHQQFVEAAVALGATHRRVLSKAVFPAILPYITVSVTVSIGWNILQTASLSFLGLGAQPPTPEWGAMLSESRQYLTIAPHSVVLPGLVLLFVVVGLNLIGDALRDALDVKLKD